MLRRLQGFLFPEHGARRPKPYGVVLAAGLAAGLALALTDPVQRLEWALYDRSMRHATRHGDPAPDVAVVAIDEPSVAELGGRWPWPRSVHATLIDQLVRAGARAIAFDVLFDAPGHSAADDEELVQAARRAGNVVVACDLASLENRGYALSQWVQPFAELGGAVAGTGAVRLPYDPDGVIRRAAFTVAGHPTLALAGVRRDPGFRDPADPARPRLMRFRGPTRRGIPTVSYYQALDADRLLPARFFKDRIVFIGHSRGAVSIGEATDHYPTPVALQMAGVEVHATIADSLLRGRFVRDPFGSWAALLGLLAVAGAAVAILMYRLPPMVAACAAAVLPVALAASGYALLAAADIRLPVVAPSVMVIAAYGTAAAYGFALTSRERRLIKRAFQHYVAPAIVAEMLDDPSKLTLGGREYDVSVLFSDIEGFTTLSEQIPPGDVSALLARYFRAVLDALLAERGTLDKLMGDGFMMYFGCPIADPQHAEQACRGALAMQRRMEELNRQWCAQGLRVLRTRVGINSGRVIAGNMGTDGIFNFTVLGDCVNLASRLEGVNKEYGTLVLIGEDTHALVSGRFATREVDWIRVKGKERPVAVFELAAAAGELDAARREAFDRYAAGLALYRQMRWREAEEAFEGARAVCPADGPSEVMRQRCRAYAAKPPADPWDGVHVMQTK